MAQPPAKRARPAFSPPRPKNTKSSTSNGVSKSRVSTKKPRGQPSLPKDTLKKQKLKQKSRVIEFEAEDNDDEPEDEDGDQDQGDRDEEDEDARSQSHSGSEQESSPEPDFILAEVTYDAPSSSNSAIPLDLVQHIAQLDFRYKKKTKISKDAKEVLGKYVEVFVREAIMRCVYTSQERNEGGVRDDSAVGGGDGWLEVEALERVSAQLCLDF